MTELIWYTFMFSLSGIREIEFQKAVVGFQNLFESFPHLKNVSISGENNVIFIQFDAEDLNNLELEKIGGRAKEEVLEALPAVLNRPSGVTVNVLEVKEANK